MNIKTIKSKLDKIAVEGPYWGDINMHSVYCYRNGQLMMKWYELSEPKAREIFENEKRKGDFDYIELLKAELVESYDVNDDGRDPLTEEEQEFENE